MEVCTEEVCTLLYVTIPKYICFQVQTNTFKYICFHVRVTIKETGNKPLAFKNCKVFCSYPSLHQHPHQKSLLRILKFKNKKNTILQLSTKPVTTNASWMSYEPKDEAQRKHLSQAKPCQPHITDKSHSLFLIWA